MRAFFLMILLLIGGFVIAQDPVIKLDATVYNDDTGKKMSGATVEVLQDGKSFTTETSASNGRVPIIDLPVGYVYTVRIKKSGYVTKIAKIDARYDYPEDLADYAALQFKPGIFEQVEGIDFSFLESTPMIEYEMDANGFLDYDPKKLKEMQKKIEDLKRQMEEKKEELEKEKEEQAKRQADFDAYVKAGDGAMKKQEYERAISQYELALGLIDDHQPTIDKLEDAKIKLEELREAEQLEKEFGDKMTAAKNAYTANELEKALTLYKEASDIKPDEQLPKDRIAEIEKKIADQKKNEEAFKALVTAGDAAVSSESFDEAISKYQEALGLKDDAEVKTKLEDAQKKKADKEAAEAAEKATKEKYDQLIASADAAMDTEKFEEAKKNYEEASKLLPDEQKPKDKIAEIEKILKERAEQEAAAEKLEADYKKAIETADEFFKQRKWEEAKNSYNEALKLKASDTYAQDQLNAITKAVAEEAAAAKLDEEYNAHMAEGKTLFDQKKYEEAKSAYNNALAVKPEEQEPKDKIAEIEGLIADAAKAAEQEEQYKNFMADGAAANDRKDYNSALDNYKKALEIKPGDPDATTQIDAINKVIEEEKRLADEQAKFDAFIASAKEAFNAKNYDQAKLDYNNALEIRDDEEVKAKIKEIDEIIAKNQSEAETQAKYDAAIKEADELYDANDNEAALTKYKEALSIKENDYPKQRISELNEKIEAAKAAEAKEKEFNELIASADEAYNAKDYSVALAKYKEAIAVKPDSEISQKIADINVLIAEESQNAEKRKNYDAKIAEADAAFDDENWDGARALYEAAQLILPSESYPEDQINEIIKRMNEESAAEEEKLYQKIIDKADALRDDDKLDDAIGYYERAISAKPSDDYPKEQIEKIRALQKERADALADQEKLDKDYNQFIARGEEAYNAENWDVAADNYIAALKLKPGESLPTERMIEIKRKQEAAEREKKIDEEYDALIKKADKFFNGQGYGEAINAYEEALRLKPDETYPKERIESVKRLLRLATESEEEEAYQKLLREAQNKMDASDYKGSLELYNQAKISRPSDPFPQQRIDEINQILNQQEEDEKLEADYKEFITKADNQFEQGNWKEAKEFYISAYNLINREYPEEQIKRCEASMKEKTDEEVEKQYTKIIKAADGHFDKSNYEKAKELYERALTFKPNDQYPKSKLDEIDRILNPDKYARTTKGNLNNYGDPNRSVNSIDIDAMLADAEEQRKFNEAQKVEAQRADANEALSIKSSDQTDQSHETIGEVNEMREDISHAGDAAELALKESVEVVGGMQDGLRETGRERGEWNENVIQQQKQVVNNITTEIEERDLESDQPREDYLLDVEIIRSEIAVESELNARDQENETFEQKDYVSDFEENRLEKDPNRDVPRLNAEVGIEDFTIQVINAENENVWDHEDEVMAAKEFIVSEDESREADDLERDIPRVEGIGKIEDENLTRVELERRAKNEQYDVTIDQKKYTDNVVEEITIEQMNNDLPRERMEEFTEKQRLELADVSENLEIDQNNQMYKTGETVEEMELAIKDNQLEDEKQREGYEKVVEGIKDGKEGYLEDKVLESEDEMHATIDYLEEKDLDRKEEEKMANNEANENIDNTADMIEGMREENAELGEKSQKDLEEAEDYVESLRDIKVNEIDEEMKNDLGSRFPEGVTEEVYTIEDEDGLIVSYIVRRIVVRNGVGNVYEKVQTAHGSESYTVNGVAITEYDWQDQTEAADLVRN